ncbi:tryptophan tryptophylquinone biosynthesis enzyme MauG [Ancylobacter sp. 6x-1]|uniref:Tryptophan tryptophylquinone biosynthesis enzyme MauG n=1 Tax=Ancylobacter crimeensis TaxID=2579147 RepID=A0ABT0DDH0_9HYPH|nr:tryptophan tryptophylquinone biosynthesis enzyme MauG [Ancylobacter crimeensis]MCK0197914.1 tryptophan tryptophylquinone biosynthesis enzyme MauG [Ancylobacter crimeensis]
MGDRAQDNRLRRRAFRPALTVPFLAALCALASGLGLAQAGRSAPPELAGEAVRSTKAAFRRPADTPFPGTNPFSPEKEALGKALFFDPRLSRSGSVSCATCHNPSLGWTDGLPRAVGFGMEILPRRTPQVRNLAWAAAFQWDGRADSLEMQARMPITAPAEMNMTMDLVIARLKAAPGYAPLFRAAFAGDDPLNAGNLLAALATYERTLVSPRAPFDRWIEGDEAAIGPDAKQGFALFIGKAGCSACHSGWRFTDDSFHDIGLAVTEDVGRGAFAPPSVTAMQHAFKTPSLRELRMQGPYMHDGQLPDLDAVLEHYARGGEKRPSLSFEMKPLELAADERRALVAFLQTLKAEPVPVALPHLP